MSPKKNTKDFQKKLLTFLHTIGDNLYALRISRKESLNDVARTVKMSPSRLSKLEKGLCPHCRILTLIHLCKYYKIKLSDLASEGKFTVRKEKPE